MKIATKTKAKKPAKKKDELAGAKALDRGRFEQDLVKFINTVLVPSDKPAVQADSLLFKEGLINSLKILDLIAFVEKSIGVRVPEKYMVMEYFQSPAKIATTFARS